MSYKPTRLENAEYLRDLSRLTVNELTDKWGVSNQAVYNHLKMGAKEIKRRLAEIETPELLRAENEALKAFQEELVRELSACQAVLHNLAHDGLVTPDYARDAKAVLKRVPE